LAGRSKVAEELSASHGLVAEAEARAGELETALQDYMVKAHKAKITSEEVAAKGAAKQTKKESDAAAGSSLEELQRLRRELTDLQAERDDYVKEREAELAALGDGLPPQ
jgi:predicted  nucleic acid-binding Zn-ribbon protein